MEEQTFTLVTRLHPNAPLPRGIILCVNVASILYWAAASPCLSMETEGPHSHISTIKMGLIKCVVNYSTCSIFGGTIVQLVLRNKTINNMFLKNIFVDLIRQ